MNFGLSEFLAAILCGLPYWFFTKTALACFHLASIYWQNVQTSYFEYFEAADHEFWGFEILICHFEWFAILNFSKKNDSYSLSLITRMLKLGIWGILGKVLIKFAIQKILGDLVLVLRQDRDLNKRIILGISRAGNFS